MHGKKRKKRVLILCMAWQARNPFQGGDFMVM